MAAVCLLLGVLGGLLRLGWALPAAPAASAWHGALVVGGFLGTLISLERALALGRWWPFAAPVTAGLGAVALLIGWPPAIGALAMAVASAVLVAANVVIMRRQLADYTVTMALGAAAWLVANLLWLAGWPAYRLVPWWAVFLVLTIVGERLDLSRLRRPSPAARWAFAGGVALLLGGATVGLVEPDGGIRLFGLGLVALAVWLFRYDIAGRTVRQRGLPRYIAICLLTGYGWLATAGLLALVVGATPAGPAHDALVHSLFLGYVMAMIFGHMPIIAPLVLGRGIAYRAVLYLPLALLHLSLALRIASDLAGWLPGRQWGGLLNAAALVTFAIAVAATVGRAGRRSA
ncbi:MAG: hypothetical protein IT340_02275 [Chloroflexi bacterium]|nr:hypothetical protein [Chloroflexota bacterium]